MVRAETDVLETLVLQEVSRGARSVGIESIDEERALVAAREVLERPDLSEEERKALDSEGVGQVLDPQATVLSVRTREAARAALDAAIEDKETLATIPLPQVVVLSEEQATMATATSRTVAETVADTVATLATVSMDVEEGLRTIVLAPADSRASLEADGTLATMAGGTVAFRELDETVALDTAVDVVCVDAKLGKAEEVTREIVRAASKPVDRGDDLVGELFNDKYRLTRRIGGGGFGVVYEAVDEAGLGNRVAIKILRPHVARKEKNLEAFRQEALRVTKIDNPYIVDWKVFDRTPDGRYFFVMELLDGEELEDVLEREGTLSPERTAAILFQVVDALRAAHHVGEDESILHLDLKPANVFVVRKRSEQDDERIKVIDFGVGQHLGAQSSVKAGEVQLVQGITPEYASPEQCTHHLPDVESQPLDMRADLYSVGVMGFQMLTGRLPFPTPSNRRDFLKLHLEAPPMRLAEANKKIPKPLVRFIERCLRKDPAKRFESTHEAWRELRNIVHPVASRKLGLAAVAVALLATIGFTTQAVLGGNSVPLRVTVLKPDANGDGVIEDDETPNVLDSGQLIALGPQRTAVTLLGSNDPDVRGLPDGANDWSVHFSSGNLVPSATARREGNSLILEVDDAAPPGVERAARVYLEARALGELYRTPEFRIRWVDLADWEPAPPRLSDGPGGALSPGRGRVHPSGRLILPDLGDELPQDLIGRIEVSLNGGPREEFTQEQARAGIALSRFGEVLGPTEIEVSVFDRGGGAHVSAGRFEFVPSMLEIVEQPSVEGGAAGSNDRRIVWSGVAPTVRLSTNRDAVLRWTVSSEGLKGMDLTRETLLPATNHVISLDKSTLGRLLADFGDGVYDARLSITALEDPGVDLAPGVTVEVNAKPIEFEVRKGELRIRDVKLADVQANEDGVWCVDTTTPKLKVTGPEGFGGLFIDVRALRVVAGVGGAESEAWEDVDLGTRIESINTEFSDVLDFDLAFVGEDGDPLPDGDYRLLISAAPTREALEQRQSGGIAHTLELPIRIDTTPPTGFGIEPRKPAAFAYLDPSDLESWSISVTDVGVDFFDFQFHEWAPFAERWVPVDEGVYSVDAVGRTLRLVAGALHDGKYRLSASVHDDAGNVARLTPPQEFYVIAQAPVIERDGSPRVQGRNAHITEFLVETRDGVGFSSLTGRMVHEAEGSDADWVDVAFTLERASQPRERGPVVQSWKLTEAFDEEWAGRDVRFDLEAVRIEPPIEAPSPVPADYLALHGRVPLALDGLTLPEFEPYHEPRIDAPLPVGGFTPMRLVSIDRASMELRADEEIDRALEGAYREHEGFDPLGRVPREASSSIPLLRDDYYLDEDEVSCGEFLAFLEDEASGYLHAPNWPAGTYAPRANLEQFARELTAIRDEQDRAVTGVTWAEASAFAAWRGCVLPTAEQWLYAVRGGSEQRVWSGEQRDAELPAMPANTRPFGETVLGEQRLLPSEKSSGGDDAEATAPERIHADVSVANVLNLCGNVREWTRTAAGAGDAPRYVVVGGSYRRWNFDYTARELHHRPGDHADDLGFRCALLARDARELTQP